MSINEKALKRLKKDLKGKVVDEWANGTVIRWTSSGRYTYAAIKTVAGWFTTARVFAREYETVATGNGYVDQVVDYEGLLEILSRSETSDVAVATEWAEIL